MTDLIGYALLDLQSEGLATAIAGMPARHKLGDGRVVFFDKVGQVNGNPAAQAANASSAAVPVIMLATYSSSGAVFPRTFTPAKDGEQTNGNTLYVAWKIYTSSPADVTIDMNDNGDANQIYSGFIECS